MRADELASGACAKIAKIDAPAKLHDHFFHQGIYAGAKICFLRCAPLHDPLLFEIEGIFFAIRRKDAHQILLKD